MLRSMLRQKHVVSCPNRLNKLTSRSRQIAHRCDIRRQCTRNSLATKTSPASVALQLLKAASTHLPSLTAQSEELLKNAKAEGETQMNEKWGIHKLKNLALVTFASIMAHVHHGGAEGIVTMLVLGIGYRYISSICSFASESQPDFSDGLS